MNLTVALLLVCVQAEPQPKLAIDLNAGRYSSHVTTDVYLKTSDESAGDSQSSLSPMQEHDKLFNRNGLNTSSHHSSASLGSEYAESSVTSIALFHLDKHEPAIHSGSQLNFDSRLINGRRGVEIESRLAGLSKSKVFGDFVIVERPFVTQDVRVTCRVEFRAWSASPTVPNALYSLSAKVGDTHVSAGWDHKQRQWNVGVHGTAEERRIIFHEQIRQPGTGDRLRDPWAPRSIPGRIKPLRLDDIHVGEPERTSQAIPSVEPEPEPIATTYNRLSIWAIDVTDVMEMEAFRTRFHMEANTEISAYKSARRSNDLNSETPAKEHESADIYLEVRVYCLGVTPVADTPSFSQQIEPREANGSNILPNPVSDRRDRLVRYAQKAEVQGRYPGVQARRSLSSEVVR